MRSSHLKNWAQGPDREVGAKCALVFAKHKEVGHMKARLFRIIGSTAALIALAIILEAQRKVPH
jgi:hypothetical protein